MTGNPGVGKTTALLRAVELLKISGAVVGGVVSREVRAGGARKGFELVDILNGRTGTLADVSGNGPRLGKYRVNLAGLEAVGVVAIRLSIESADVVAVDEVGPMELLSAEFLKAVREALDSGKPVVGTIHRNLKHPVAEEIRSRKDVEVLEVTRDNRDAIPVKVAEAVLEFLGRKSKP
ncbi:MAG: NTPase [Candidatus Brockarchaeota archaeon]|nr:NTPase [Candidatus Brockarchaeota archaeon]